ncbi:hypothetical protein SEVIR_7G255800v4 [Setaria viridis]|uniref:Uncharacterized protein n=2 Tax=Setaria TaxID=4554 RepID=A0A4U6U0C7_SETVI|nr:microtubule-associated protein tau-like [Setaria italica]XP_034603009.1 microtubule-associated protein tau-like [Setaria viridis]TKW06689.1 hypothetical protein SEVIR_7G255800v2 [Setaria viridis]
MAATRKPRSPPAAASGDHHRFLRPGALARLRDARLRRGGRASRLPPPSSPAPASPPASPPPPAAGDGDGEGGAAVPYFVPVTRLLAPQCPQRKKLAAAKYAVLFSPPPPSPDLPLEAVIEFLSSPDMVVAAH